MTELVIVLAVLAIAAGAGVFFFLGFITAGKAELRKYVLCIVALLVLFIGTMVVLRGPQELLNHVLFVAWVSGVLAGKVYSLLKQHRNQD